MIFFELFITFFKIGAFTFGGGYAMIPLIQEEVLAHKWLDMKSLVNFIAVSESTPGPFAINIATYIGSEKAGFWGAFCATLGVVLPSFIIILIIARFFMKFKKSKAVIGVMSGLRPTVIALIAGAVISIGKTVFFPEAFGVSVLTSFAFISSLIIFGAMLVLVFKKLHPILIILLSAALGITFGYAERLFI